MKPLKVNDLEPIIEPYSDVDIIQKVCEGEVKMYEVLIRRYNSFLYKIGRSYRYNHQETEDLMQETYINAFQNFSKFENRSSFKTWFARIMLNNCYHKKYKLSFRNEIITDDIQTEKSNNLFHEPAHDGEIIVNRELRSILENAIRKIPENYRIIFTLRELSGLSVVETSECLDISESNVKARLSRAKAMLRTEIEKLYSTDDIFEFNCVYCDSMVKKVMTIITGEN